VNAILAIPLEVRLVAMVALGLCAGSLVNWGVYRLAWQPRPIGPWSPPDPAAPRRPWMARLPVLGWLALRDETPLHGRGFWIRPMLLELVLGFAFAGLYWWEAGRLGLLPAGIPPLQAVQMANVHAQFAAHLVLLCLMLVASLIDVDQRIIPDAVTVPGVLIGILLAALFPWSLLPADVLVFPGPRGQVLLDFLKLTSPGPWPFSLGPPAIAPLAIALGCWWLWCVAILPRTWRPRHGWRRAVQLAAARLKRERSTWLILLMGLLGSLVIFGVWIKGGPYWQGVLSALVGLAVSGGIVWAVRVLGTAALNREAMGFGDVTLMAMIGAFLGWQPGLIIFFLAPLAGVVVGVFQLIFFRESEIPYGPFLCIATAGTIVAWAPIWNRAQDWFALGWLLVVLMGICLALLPLLLGLWRLVRAVVR